MTAWANARQVPASRVTRVSPSQAEQLTLPPEKSDRNPSSRRQSSTDAYGTSNGAPLKRPLTVNVMTLSRFCLGTGAWPAVWPRVGFCTAHASRLAACARQTASHCRDDAGGLAWTRRGPGEGDAKQTASWPHHGDDVAGDYRHLYGNRGPDNESRRDKCRACAPGPSVSPAPCPVYDEVRFWPRHQMNVGPGPGGGFGGWCLSPRPGQW